MPSQVESPWAAATSWFRPSKAFAAEKDLQAAQPDIDGAGKPPR
jgi:hypothetical protein